jgi:hypothetical protein
MLESPQCQGNPGGHKKLGDIPGIIAWRIEKMYHEKIS